MKLTPEQLRQMIEEEINLFEMEEEEPFDPSISSELFGHIKDLLVYDFETGLTFLQSDLGLDEISEKEKEELVKISWKEISEHKEEPEYKLFKDGLNMAKINWQQKHVEHYKKKLAALDLAAGDKIEAVGELMGFEDPYQDMLSIVHFGRWEYFHQKLKEKGIL